MYAFLRAFILTLFASVILICFALCISFVNREVAESGFSSGEVFAFEHEGDILSGEVFGKSFSADISAVYPAVSFFKLSAVFLPLPVQLLLRLCSAFFEHGL